MEHGSDNCCFNLDPLVFSLILCMCPGSLEKFHLQNVMTRRSCIVPEMVVLVISVDLLILVDLLLLAGIPSSVFLGCAGWCGFFSVLQI